MRNLLSALVLGTVLATSSAVSSAQSLTDTITVEGELTYAEHSFLGGAALTENAHFIATLEVNRFAPASNFDPTQLEFPASVLSLEVTLFEDQGIALDTGAVPTSCEVIVGAPQTMSKAFADGAQTRAAVYRMQGSDMNGRTQFCAVGIEQMMMQLFAAGIGFPVPLAGASDADFTATFEVASERGSQMVWAAGIARNITLESLDSDQDGVADWDDNCASSDLSETVVFADDHDSGVTNHTDANGCTIMDHYAACETEKTTSFLSYQGPSYCESQVAYQMYGMQLINYTEVRQLRTALMAASRD